MTPEVMLALITLGENTVVAALWLGTTIVVAALILGILYLFLWMFIKLMR